MSGSEISFLYIFLYMDRNVVNLLKTKTLCYAVKHEKDMFFMLWSIILKHLDLNHHNPKNTLKKKDFCI